MITIEQCRGARGILAWTQQDLADACGLSKTAINNFEKGHSDIKAESLKAIRMAFESAEIQFIGHHGVAKKSESTRFLRGPSALNDLIEDIHKTLPTDGEILISHANEGLAKRISTQVLFKHIDFLKNQDIKERMLCTEPTKHVLSPQDDCRTLNQGTEHSAPTTFIYGSKVAFELWDKTMILLIESPNASESERNRFEHLWANAKDSRQKDGQQKITKTRKQKG